MQGFLRELPETAFENERLQLSHGMRNEMYLSNEAALDRPSLHSCLLR
jgi:hypothetical protein